MCKCLRLYERGGELESSFSYWTPPVWTLSGQITECFSASFPLQQIAVPRTDEWTRFVRTLTEINENREDAEELVAQRIPS